MDDIPGRQPLEEDNNEIDQHMEGLTLEVK